MTFVRFPIYSVRLDVAGVGSRGFYEKRVAAKDAEHAIARVCGMAKREHLTVEGVVTVALVEP